MGSLEDRARMREKIAMVESADRKRLEEEITTPHEGADPQIHPDLPPPIPRPEYATSPGVIGRDDTEVDFYVSCQAGRLDEVKEYIESHQPPNLVLQYGLEQASFAGHPAVVLYLLESGAILHGNIFSHLHSIEKPEFSKREYPHAKSLFSSLEGSQDLIALLDVFLDAGWHPNQPWYYPLSKGTCQVIEKISGNKVVVKYLVERLPGLRFAPGHGRLISALRAWDTELLDLLLSHGADATVGAPLFKLVERERSETEKYLLSTRSPMPPVPFSQRRATAEWLLQHGVRINDVDKALANDLTRPLRMWVDETALSLACRSQDWEFAEWLLENGADPGLLGGRALDQLWWSFPDYGKNDPSVARELVERVRARHGGKLPAEGGQ